MNADTGDFHHYTAQSLITLDPVSHRDRFADLWARLKRRFPHALATLLMPDHPHLLLRTSEPDQIRWQLSVELRAFARRQFPGQRVWLPVPSPRRVPNLPYLKRTLRYISLNPCREGLVRDPLDWEWSTHRDLVGAVYPRWVEPARLASSLNGPRAEFTERDFDERDFIEKFHRYISSDPTAAIGGTPFPRQPGPNFAMAANLTAITRAALIVTRAKSGDLLRPSPARQLAIELCRRLGPHLRPELAGRLDVTLRTIQRSELIQVDARAIAAALLVLTDRRLIGNAMLKSPRMSPLATFSRVDLGSEHANVAQSDIA